MLVCRPTSQEEYNFITEEVKASIVILDEVDGKVEIGAQLGGKWNFFPSS